RLAYLFTAQRSSSQTLRAADRFHPRTAMALQSTLLPSLRTTGAGPGARKAQRTLPSRSYGSWGKRKCRRVLDQRGHGKYWIEEVAACLVAVAEHVPGHEIFCGM